jgi:uncharacterized membrane protein YcaP (DUF421 family)
MDLLSIDWRELFVPSGSLAEMVVRGTVIYLLLFVLLRLLPRRQVGAMGVSDIIVIVLIADAAQNGMAGEYRSITEGLVLIVTLLGWDYLIDWLDDRFPHLNLAASPPLQVVRNGRLLKSHLRKEHMSEDELMSQLRERGIDRLETVREAYVEGDGRVSVIAQQPPAPPQPPTGGSQKAM